MNNSLFITFEGGDGAGKSTLIEKIEAKLKAQGLHPLTTRAPGGTPAGEEIRHLLLQKQLHLTPRAEMLLFLADRAQHVKAVIRPALKEGKIVLCDRFNDSTLAYQGGARGIPEQEVRQLCNFACDGLWPDLTFYLDLDPQIGLSRLKGKKDRIEGEEMTFHQKIREAFHAIARKEPSRMAVIDAAQPPETVFSEAMRTIHARL